MYYLTKFCRICIQSGVKLLDLDTLDFDCVKLSDKLKVCTKMVVVEGESLSTEICIQCITKLRISYQFQDMCKKSTKILHSYLTELIGTNNDKEIPKDFVNTELEVRLTPLTMVNSVHKRRRITKEQRCSLLKRLLAPSTKWKERDKYQNHDKNWQSGGLKGIINFTRNYEFGWQPQNEQTHLDKLQEFSTNFFRNDFSEFRDTILYIIENKDNYTDSEDDEDCFFDDVVVKEELQMDSPKFEEVIVEPDIKIKREVDFECEDNETEYNYDEMECKREIPDDNSSNQSSFTTHLPNNNNNNNNNTFVTDHSAMHLLDKLVENYTRKSFSAHNVRCRTRNNPYISPILKEQFYLRSFRCEKCNRHFKSLAYLKSHNSKVH